MSLLKMDVKGQTWAIVLASNGLLLILILVSPHHPIYDEGIYLTGTRLLDTYGFSRDFLRDYPGPAGPLHSIVYDAFIGLFGLTFPYLRLVSFGFLIVSAWLLSIIASITVLSHNLPDRTPARLTGAIFTVVPTAGVSAGMTLTEMPAMLFLGFSLLLLAWAMSTSWLGASITFAAAAGLTLGIAVLGRQNYLLLMPCLLMLLISDKRTWRRNATPIAVLCATTIAIVTPIFVIWGGLVPPKFASVGEGISLWNGVLTLGYGGIVAFLVAPEIIRGGKWPLLFAVTFAFVLWSSTDASIMPMQTAILAIVGVSGATMIATFFGIGIALVATYFLGCFLVYLWINRGNKMICFFGLAALTGFISNVKITHQFSSRYVFVFVPLLLLSLAPALRLNWHLPLRVASGACISLISIASYLLLAKP